VCWRSEIVGHSPLHDVANVWLRAMPLGDKFSADFIYSNEISLGEAAESILDMPCTKIKGI